MKHPHNDGTVCLVTGGGDDNINVGFWTDVVFKFA